jgi:hypothetical protein
MVTQDSSVALLPNLFVYHISTEGPLAQNSGIYHECHIERVFLSKSVLLWPKTHLSFYMK